MAATVNLLQIKKECCICDGKSPCPNECFNGYYYKFTDLAYEIFLKNMRKSINETRNTKNK